MTGDDVIAALDVPDAARVDRRVPKTLFVEHGAATATDRRHINEDVDRIVWVAALKPTTIGVVAYRDDAREYREIALLRVVLRYATKARRLIELLHRAVPYPVLAVTELDGGASLSVAHKRWSQSEAGKTVLEGELVAVDAPSDGDQYEPTFSAVLAVSRQPRDSLLEFYQGWVDILVALEAAKRTGRFELLDTFERRAARRDGLRECMRLEAEMVRLRAAAARQKQIARQVELNLKLKRAEAARAAVLTQL